MPMLMWPLWLFKAGFLAFRTRLIPTICKPSATQNTVGGSRADSHHIFVSHHISQTPIAFIPMLFLVFDNGFFLPIFQPEIARYMAVVPVGLAKPAFPIIVFAPGQPDSSEHLCQRHTRTSLKFLQTRNNAVSRLRGDPTSGQISPNSFFRSFRFSSVSQAMTSRMSVILLLNCSFLRSRALLPFLCLPEKVSNALSNKSFFHL